jgi:hypothetical protein
MRMPFGKHKGERVEDTPTDYLEWALANVADLDPRLRRAILAELGRNQPQPAPQQASATTVPVLPRAKVEEGLKAWYRQATMKYHPDHRGGSNEAQRIVNECYESLCELIVGAGGGR